MSLDFCYVDPMSYNKELVIQWRNLCMDEWEYTTSMGSINEGRSER